MPFELFFPPLSPSLPKASCSRAKALYQRNFRPFGIGSAKNLPFLPLFQTFRRIFSKASCGILRFFRLRKTPPPQIPRIENRAGTHLKGKLSATSAFPKSFPFCPEKATFKIERRESRKSSGALSKNLFFVASFRVQGFRRKILFAGRGGNALDCAV